MDICEKDVTAAREALIAAVAEQHSGDAAFESRRLPVDSQGPFLDGSLLAALESVREQLAERGLMTGLPAPRTIVSVLGYVGMGNFGDEYILATVDRRLRELVCGCSIVAVGENPLHTLRERGIYSITLQDKRVLDRVLAASSAALVIAGLLFDQGIRWSIGKAELASSMPHTDIAGITAYVELAYMNDARPVLYGIGAGPLDVADGRSLVRLMGRLGALFLTRDEATAEPHPLVPGAQRAGDIACRLRVFGKCFRHIVCRRMVRIRRDRPRVAQGRGGFAARVRERARRFRRAGCRRDFEGAGGSSRRGLRSVYPRLERPCACRAHRGASSRSGGAPHLRCGGAHRAGGGLPLALLGRPLDALPCVPSAWIVLQTMRWPGISSQGGVALRGLGAGGHAAFHERGHRGDHRGSGIRPRLRRPARVRADEPRVRAAQEEWRIGEHPA